MPSATQRRTAGGSTTTLRHPSATPLSPGGRSRDTDYDSSRSFNTSIPPHHRLGPSDYGYQNTSVNIAQAFTQAQTGSSLMPPPPSGGPLRSPMSPHRSPLLSPPSLPRRELSPAAGVMANHARATSPVSFYLRPTEGLDDMSANTTFSSLGEQNSSGDSYSYTAEEAVVQQRKTVSSSSSSTTAAAAKRSKVRPRRFGKEGDMPWRPVDDDDSDEEGGAGVVAQGGLNGRSATRGTRAERGEGYLGTGELSFRSRANRKSVNYTEIDSANEDEDAYREPTPAPAAPPIELTPVVNGMRSPTPRVRTGSLRPDPMDRRHRQPTPQRVMATNLALGAAETNRFVVDSIGRLFGNGFKTSRKAYRKIKHNGGWKVVGAFVALALALRVVWLSSASSSSSSSSASYHPPTAPPGSMEELVARLSSIEQALSDLSAVSGDREAAGNKAALTLTDRLHGLEASVKSGHNILDAKSGEASRDVRSLRDSIKEIKGDLLDVTSRVSGHDGKFKVVDGELQQLKGRVAAVETEVRRALDDGRLASALERLLPTRVPVHYNNGDMVLDASFWNELKKVFVGGGEVEATVRRLIADGVKTPEHGKRDDRMDERELEDRLEKMLDKRVSQVWPARAEVIEMIEQQVVALREELKTVRDRSAGAAVPVGKNQQQPVVQIKTAKGQDITSTLQALVDAALLKYSKDTIALPDYALFTAGGRVIPSATSDTLVLQQPSRFSKWLKGDKNVEGRQPATALHPDNAVGSCWPFAGSRGQLGVLLARRVVVKAVTVEHAATELALDMTTAPKEIEVWATVEGAENQAKAAQYLLKRGDSIASSIPQTPDRILLTTITYDASSSAPIQTFPVSPEVAALGIDTGIVIFLVESNWGGDFTCLYRVRVHGDAVAAPIEMLEQEEVVV